MTILYITIALIVGFTIGLMVASKKTSVDTDVDVDTDVKVRRRGILIRNLTTNDSKDTNSGSSKLEKARSLGVKIISIEDLDILLKSHN